MICLDGLALSASIFQALKAEVKVFKERKNFAPGLAVVLVGNNPASKIYVRHKIKRCEELGFYSVLKELPETIKESELQKEILSLNQDSKIHAILVQLPLPIALQQQKVLSCIDPKKDVDGLTLENLALLCSHQAQVVPCTARGIITLLKHYKISIEGKRALVVGRSLIVGLPTAHQLLQHQATVTIAHSKTKSLKEHSRQADILVACAGKHHLLNKEDFKKDAVVIDVGIHRLGNQIQGDVNPKGLENHLKAFSPVPGGVGPMTIASLMQNTLDLAGLA